MIDEGGGFASTDVPIVLGSKPFRKGAASAIGRSTMGPMLSSMYLELLKPLWSQQSLRSCYWQGRILPGRRQLRSTVCGLINA